MTAQEPKHGGQLVAEFLKKQGVDFIYTLCGGHISPILVAADQQGIKVIDTRNEASAVFAADASARLTGIPGVAAVTAGPGVTNTITALKNAQMAQSPVVLIGGAAAVLLKGKGSLQDIDQLNLLRSICKWTVSCKTVRDIVPALTKAFRLAQEGVPGPVFIEMPIDLLYPEAIVRQWSLAMASGKGMGSQALKTYLKTHLANKFAKAWSQKIPVVAPPLAPMPQTAQVQKVMEILSRAERPVLVIGSQAMLNAPKALTLQQSLLALGIPTFLSGMARGLLGKNALHIRHNRGKALKQADVIILAGVSADFRLGYGASIPRSATYISINRSKHDLFLNRKPTLPILADPGGFMRMLAASWDAPPLRWQHWHTHLSERDAERETQISSQAAQETDLINPLHFLQQIESVIDEDSVLIGDGGDFVASASYIVRPRSPLSWLDPGAFGTLGSGGGFALAAACIRPKAEIWLLYGDGSCGYSLAEFDTFARHHLPVIAVVGNDAGWTQIAREQKDIFGTAISTELAHSAYHLVAEGYGGIGLRLDDPRKINETLIEAKAIARAGKPVLINVMISQTDFRKGSISM